MQALNEFLEFLVAMSAKLEGLPSLALVVVACLLVGWFLKGLQKFPNDAIPWVVVFVGMLGTVLLTDWRGSNLPMRICVLRSVFVGLIVGVATCKLHDVFLRHIENKIPGVKGWLKDSNTDAPPGS